MNSKTMRRLAADHAELHTSLPVNYLFAPTAAHSDDLTRVDILLAGPTHTPFARGVWKLHLTIPTNYPQSPPNAILGTRIFHPNVSENGQICVETIKRDWDSKLTLRDVLVTISCLLIQPNPDSALNADAGALIQRDYGLFAKRAELMTRLHASIPASLAAAVEEAQNRGQEVAAVSDAESEVNDSMMRPELPARRRRTIARVRGVRRPDTSPGDAPGRRARRPPPATPATASSAGQPFVRQVGGDDVFGTPRAATRHRPDHDNATDDVDSEMLDADQENDTARPARKPSPAATTRTPRRPHGIAVPLGELTIPEQDEGDTTQDTDEEVDEKMELEYPPSPRKSPSKSPNKPLFRPAPKYQAESSRDAVAAASLFGTRGTAPIVTPTNSSGNPLSNTLTLSPPKRANDRGGRGIFAISKRLTPEQQLESSFMDVENSFFNPQACGTPPRPKGILKNKSPNASEVRAQEAQRRKELNSKLWEACGKDIRRWNRGDFTGDILEKKAARW